MRTRISSYVFLGLILLQAVLVFADNGQGKGKDKDKDKDKGSGKGKGNSKAKGRGSVLTPAEAARHGLTEEEYQEMKVKAVELKTRLCTEHNISENECSTDEYFGTSLIYIKLLQKMLERRSRRAVSIDFNIEPTYKWTSTSLTYRIQGLSLPYSSFVEQAFMFWNDRTCFNFVQVGSDEDILVVVTSSRCSTLVGSSTSNHPHVINVNPDLCLKECGMMMGLIAKALGFYDEQTRTDRDSYVSVDFDNVNDPSVFQIMSPVTTYSSPYDYTSILHAHAYTSATNSVVRTIHTDNANYQMNLGQTVAPSFWDVKSVNEAYCSGACPAQPCLHGGYRNPNNCGECICPDGWAGMVCESVAISGGGCSPAFSIINVPGMAPFTITSQGYPGVYPQGPGQSCYYLLRAPANCQVKVEFTGGPDVLVESGHCLHWVEIKYMEDTSQPGPRFCGNQVPDTGFLISAGTDMLVIFNAEMPYCIGGVYPPTSYARTGFQLTYSLADPNCQTGTNACFTTNPCLNGGLCSWDGTTATCTCTTGFSGTYCGTAETCYNRFCQNGGACVPADGSCSCTTGWKGDDCQIRDWCVPSPCVNGACVDRTTAYSCTCQTGYYGTTCASSDCDTDPCVHGACTPIDGGYTCSCDAGWTGTDCDDVDYCVTATSGDCSSHGACINHPTESDFQCTCDTGYYGAKCERTSCPCLNGGTCVNEYSTMVCSCTDGFYGPYCGLNVGSDYCVSDPCQNGATCSNGASGWVCTCPLGFRGVNCEFVDNCISNPCSNGGTCCPEGNPYFCACPAGFYGQDCQFDHCGEYPCINGACSSLANGFSCTCNANYIGDRCDTFDMCSYLSPCQNGGICHNIEGGTACECPTGYYGTTCTELVCPCQHGGMCVFTMTANLCSCPSGYWGSLCETVIGGDLCAALGNPCANGGTCNNGIAGYTCDCVAGNTGDKCQLFDYCTADRCQNGGTCIYHPVRGYACTCTGGFYGDSCQHPCPCYNGGQCVHSGNEYTCDCPTGYSGERCENGCGVDYPMDTFMVETACTETAGGCGTETGKMCLSGHKAVLGTFRRHCNICPYVGHKYVTESVFVLQADGSFRRIIRYPWCCYRFRGLTPLYPIRRRICRRRKASGIYPTAYDRATHCVSATTAHPVP